MKVINEIDVEIFSNSKIIKALKELQAKLNEFTNSKNNQDSLSNLQKMINSLT